MFQWRSVLPDSERRLSCKFTLGSKVRYALSTCIERLSASWRKWGKEFPLLLIESSSLNTKLKNLWCYWQNDSSIKSNGFYYIILKIYKKGYISLYLCLYTYSSTLKCKEIQGTFQKPEQCLFYFWRNRILNSKKWITAWIGKFTTWGSYLFEEWCWQRSVRTPKQVILLSFASLHEL